MKPDKNNLLSEFAEKTLNNDLNNTSSSSDEDFVCDLSDEDDSGSSDQTNDDDSEESSESNEDTDEEKEDNKPLKKTNGINGKHSNNKKSSDTEHKSQNEPKKSETINGKNSTNKSSKLNQLNQHSVCCVCLNEQSETYDELVSCDSCGFCTHEGCYGICDTESKESSNSSSSTEPWFCNSCLVEDRFEPRIKQLNGLKCFKRSCELCPNTECGLLKETENGKFVHILCALYTSGIAFQNTDRLWPVVLDEIPHTRWGEQICSLCDNIRYSRTGICIKCDAGMCKTYFHVTCAQKHGFLVDPFQQQNSSDPFIAYCKLHNEKSIISSRRTNYLAMISSYKSKNLKDKRLFEIEIDKDRFFYKFERAKSNYDLEKQKTIKQQTNTKRSKMLTTCPSALKKLISKYTLINNDTLNDMVVDQQYHTTSTITFTPDFVKYYFEREAKIPQYFKELENLKQSQLELSNQEANLRKEYEMKLDERQKLIDKNKELKENFKLYANLLEKTLPKNKYPSNVLNKLLNQEIASNDIEINKRPILNDEKSKPDKNKSHNKSASNQHSKSSSVTQSKPIKQETILNNLNLNACCLICAQKTNSHLLIDCDTCKNYYHITCLDPPLSTVPKKTKLYGWECSKCVLQKDNSSDSNRETKEVIVENGSGIKRSLRRERKQRIFRSETTEDEKSSVSPRKRVRRSKKEINTTQKKKIVEKTNKKDTQKHTSDNENENVSTLKTTDSDKSQSINILSDSEAIYIHDDETESPKPKINNSIILNKDSSNAFSSPSSSFVNFNSSTSEPKSTKKARTSRSPSSVSTKSNTSNKPKSRKSLNASATVASNRRNSDVEKKRVRSLSSTNKSENDSEKIIRFADTDTKKSTASNKSLNQNKSTEKSQTIKKLKS